MLSLIGFVFVSIPASAGSWITAENTNCKLWNPDPDEQQKVRWGGKCKGGKASGDGVAEWYSYQRPPDLCECTFVDGKAEGMGVYRWTDGVTYVGEFKAGVIEGKGFIKYPDNEMYEGDFKTTYYIILFSHIVLAAIITPLSLFTLYRGWNNQLERHRNIANITLPIWLYVSVTGVIINLMLY